MIFFMSGWLIFAIVLLVCELCFEGLYLFLSFSIGCIPAAVIQKCEYSFNAQIIFFLATFLVALFILFRFSQKYVKKEKDQNNYVSAIDALPGKRGKLIEPIVGELFWGLVKLQDGQEWSAQSVDGKPISLSVEVVVVRVEGVRLIVTPVKL